MLIANYILSLIADLLFMKAHNYEISFASGGTLRVPCIHTSAYRKDTFISVAIKT